MNRIHQDNSPIIHVDGLTKRYGQLVAVNSVSFSVLRGEVFGILGPNGAGKTTTVEILEGLRTPDSGTASVNGIDVTKEPRRVKAIIGVQLQTSAFFDGLNLSEILQMFGSLYRSKVDAPAILDEVELTEKGQVPVPRAIGGSEAAVLYSRGPNQRPAGDVPG